MNSWPIASLGDVVQINPRGGTERASADLPVSFVPMAAVCEHTGSIVSSDVRSFGQVSKGFPIFGENDVLFAKISPCMENGKAAIARDLENGTGAGSTEFFVLRPTSRILSEYVFHFVRRASFREMCKANFTGSAGQQRVPKSFLEKVAIPLPPLDEQRRIVGLLERAAEIRLRAGAARAKARAIIPALFLDTFGDPATNPMGWTLTTIDAVATYTRYGPRFPDRPYSDEGAHILRTTDMGYDGALRWWQSPILPVTHDELIRYRLEKNTILITRTGATIGKVALFKGAERTCIAGAYLIELGLSGEVLGEYILHLFTSAYGQSRLVRGSRAVAQPNINAPTIRAIPLPLPPAPNSNCLCRTCPANRSHRGHTRRRRREGGSHGRRPVGGGVRVTMPTREAGDAA